MLEMFINEHLCKWYVMIMQAESNHLLITYSVLWVKSKAKSLDKLFLTLKI